MTARWDVVFSMLIYTEYSRYFVVSELIDNISMEKRNWIDECGNTVVILAELARERSTRTAC